MSPNHSSTEATADKAERSVPALMSDFTQELVTLVQQELQLARSEVSDKVGQIGSGATSIALGGAVLLAAILVVLQAIVYGLHDVLEPWSPGLWLSPLIVGLIVLVIGIMLLQKGRSNLQAKNLAPRRTVSSLQEDKEFAKEQIRR